MDGVSVAVLGAGVSGLTAVKCCLDEGLRPVCFERSGYIGGAWHFTTDDAVDTARVMRDTVVNTSKEMHAFSDFPPPREFPVYMHNTLVDKYFNMYADRFDLKKHVRFNTEVLSVRESSDHRSTGRWTVVVKDRSTEKIETLTFDGVFVCTGPYRSPVIPQFKGLDDFQGTVLTANQYIDSAPFRGKKVLVVGFGNSAADIATDLCNTTQQVYISSRSGGWLFQRMVEKGAPLDYTVTRFFSSLIAKIPSLINKLMAWKLNAKMDHCRYALNPTDPVLRSSLVVNDYLSIRLITGAVKMKPAIARFRSHGVEFVDGSDVSDIDVVILATGYKIEHGFLDSSVLGEDKTRLYKAMYPPDRDHHTLAFMYCYRLRGPVFPLVEMQGRVATRVLKGLVKLPGREEMLRSIADRKAASAATRGPRMCDIIQVDYVAFMDELAEMIGCKPNFWRLLLQDWRLALMCMFGPAVAYQFRLQGPGAWAGARDAIMSLEDRTYFGHNEGRTANHQQRHADRRARLRLLILTCAVVAIIIKLLI